MKDSFTTTHHRTAWTSITVVILIAGLLTISGCSTTPPQQANQISLAPDTFVTLPAPADLGYKLSASQLIMAQWHKQGDQTEDTNKSRQNQQQLPVQLQVDSNKVALAGFSSWGTRILSLTYENSAINTSVLAGLGDTLPKPKQVLFNLMITLWPLDAWHDTLAQVGWKLVETRQQRQLIDNHGNVIADIRYQAGDHLKGKIVFTNYKFGYTITIKTLKFTRS